MNWNVHPIGLDSADGFSQFAPERTAMNLLSRILICVSLLGATLSPAFAQLSGTYTIDAGGGGDYISFNAAVADLVALGVNGAVVFNASPGSYSEQFTIPAITGSSATNTITFRGQVSDSTLVDVWMPSTLTNLQNFLVRINSAEFMAFEHIMFRRSGAERFGAVIEIYGTSSDISFSGCHFSGSTSTSTAASSSYHVVQCSSTGTQQNMVFAGNYMENGDESIVWNSLGTDADEVTVSENVIVNGTVSFFGFQAAGALSITGNHITDGSMDDKIGLSYCDLAYAIERNTIFITGGSGHGIYLNTCQPSVGSYALVTNNACIGSFYNVSLYALRVYASYYIDIVHNTFTYGVLLDGAWLRTYNNIHRNRAISWANLTVAGNSVIASDNNLYNGPFCRVVWNGVSYYNEVLLNAATGLDANSLFANPQLVNNNTDPHLQPTSPAIGMASAFGGLVLDLDGEPRPQPIGSSNDVGADEMPLACTGLSGTYTIGPSVAADFSTFTGAVDALITCGISGATVFEVENGTYNEALQIPAIAGSSATNIITFRSQALDNTAVTLQYQSLTTYTPINHVIYLDGVDHITFEYLTIERYGSLNYGNIIRFSGSGSSGDASQYVTFQHNRIQRTGNATPNGIMVYGWNSPSTDEVGTQFLNNRFTGNASAISYTGNAADEFTIRGNEFVDVYTAISLSYVGNVVCAENQISTTFGSTPMRFSGMQAGEIRNNTVLWNGAYVGAGLELNVCNGTAVAPLIVANNAIAVNATNSTGMSITGSSSYITLYHNSLSTNAGAALYIATPMSNITARNNVLQSANTYAYHSIYATGLSIADHNVLYSGGPDLARWNSTTLTDLAALQGATGLFSASFEADPLFVDPLIDLHLQNFSPCIGNGQAIATVVDDIDGEPRPQPAGSNVDIGSDEHPVGCGPLSGTYIIGLSGAADYANFTAAVNGMISCGINGPVVFEVESGNYTNQFMLPPINGSSATNTITFRGQALDSSLVTVRWNAQSTGTNNFLLRMAGADHVTFEHLTFQRTGAYSANRYAQIVEFQQLAGTEASQFITFSHVRFRGSFYTFFYASAAGIYSANTNSELNTLVEHCRFEYCGMPINWNMNTGDDRLTVENNISVGGYQGFYFIGFDDGLVVRKNTISGLAQYFSGACITVVNSTGEFLLEQNALDVSLGSGILLNNAQGSVWSRGLVRNNVITAPWTSNYNYGILITGPTTYMDIVNNSVCIYRGNAYRDQGSGGGIRLVNNVLSSRYPANGGYAFWYNGSTTYLQLAHNCLYTGQPSFAYWGGNQTDLAALQTASGAFANSIDADPKFFDPQSDLHSYSMDLNGAGLSLTQVTNDMDDEPRSTSPDIGADEFIPELWSEQLDVCAAADGAWSDGSNKPIWIYKDRKVIGRIQDNGNTLGWINSSVYINSGAVRINAFGQYYMDRNWHIEPQNAITGANVDLRLFFNVNEFIALAAVDPAISALPDAGVSQYDGPNENCTLADNTSFGDYFIHYPAPFGAEFTIAPLLQVSYYDASLANFSEFYVTTLGNPLPVELIRFTAERTSNELVQLNWSTATEADNEGFEIWRMIEGAEELQQIGWVAGAGHSMQVIDYAIEDRNSTERVSYYQLVQRDLEGTRTASELIAVKGMRATNTILIYPNPVSTTAHLNGINEPIASIVLLDQHGSTVRTYGPSPELDLTSIAQGVYTVRVQLANGALEHSRLVVQ